MPIENEKVTEKQIMSALENSRQQSTLFGNHEIGKVQDDHVSEQALIDTSVSKSTGADQMKARGQAHYKLAKIYYDKADLVNAEKYFLMALELCVLPSDGLAIIKVSGFLVRIYSESKRKEEAQNYINVSKMVLDLLFADNNEFTAEYFFYSGVISTYQSRFKEARNFFTLAYKKSQQENEPELVAKSLYSLAQNFFQDKELDQSLRVLAQLEQLLLILNKGYLKGSMNLLYAQIFSQQGAHDKAIELYRKSMNDLNDKMCWNLMGYSLLGIGTSYKKLGEFKLALYSFDLALSSINQRTFRRLHERIQTEINELHDSNVDFFIDKHNRLISEKELGTIDFKHRFVLLEILFLLAKNPGQSFDKEQLSLLIWKEEYNPLIHDKLIYTSISRLRKLIEPSDQKNKYIIRGKDGYTFNPQINVRFHQDGEKSFESIANVEISSPI